MYFFNAILKPTGASFLKTKVGISNPDIPLPGFLQQSSNSHAGKDLYSLLICKRKKGVKTYFTGFFTHLIGLSLKESLSSVD